MKIFDPLPDGVTPLGRLRRVCMGSAEVCHGGHAGADADARVLLDVTRLVALRWTGRQATGIDRVALAYLRHFRSRARAVVQHRGVLRALTERESADVFDLLEAPKHGLRLQLARQFFAAVLTGSASPRIAGMAYLNVGHTDFDLAAHREWVRVAQVRPFYFLHDLIPIRHPEFSRPHAVRRHSGRVRSALEIAAGIVLGSETARHELEAFASAQALPLPPLAVAHLAGEELRVTTPAVPTVAPCFVCVGTIEPRKNHRLLFAVWQRLFARLGVRTPRLVIVGQVGPMTGELLAPLQGSSGWQHHVEHRRSCSDSELAGLLQHAQALLVPSLAEGFGLPFVEALQAGTPVIATNLAVFHEIGQGAAQLLDPHDEDAWVQAIVAATMAPRRGAGPDDTSDTGQTLFVPPSWPHHFDVVDQFIASPAALQPASARPSSAITCSESVHCA